MAGFGLFDGSAQQFGLANSDVLVGPLTPSVSGDIALLGVSANAGALSAGWLE